MVLEIDHCESIYTREVITLQMRAYFFFNLLVVLKQLPARRCLHIGFLWVYHFTQWILHVRHFIQAHPWSKSTDLSEWLVLSSISTTVVVWPTSIPMKTPTLETSLPYLWAFCRDEEKQCKKNPKQQEKTIHNQLKRRVVPKLVTCQSNSQISINLLLQ